MLRPAHPLRCRRVLLLATTYRYYKRARAIAFAKRCAQQVFVEMLLRGWCSSSFSTTTTLLLNPHRPRGIGRSGAATAAAFRSAVFCTAPAPDDCEGMEKKNDDNGHDHHDHKKDTMGHSFGVGYGTRSDEEGFGGVYGGNDPSESIDHHSNHPEYDKSQGSEVKEKEKARNLPEGAAASHTHDHKQGA